MDTNRQNTESSLFLVRLWPEDAPEGQPRWSGKIQQVVTGESQVFHSWPEMVAAMQRMLPQVDGEAQAQEALTGAAPTGEKRPGNPLTRMFTR